jgi:hypothetical protein
MQIAVVAQMVEHLIGNEEVSGSSPPNSLSGKAGISRCGSAWLERYVRDVEAAGSNPVTSIFLLKNSWQAKLFLVWKFRY